MNLTAERLRELLDYDPATGTFTWRVARKGIRNGDIAGCRGGRAFYGKYVRIRIDGVLYHAHRLAWLHVHGVWPEGPLDHKDRDSNALRNIRPCTPAQNACNSSLRSDNTSGFKGVTLFRGKWKAQIHLSRKNTTVGIFSDAEEAARAYDRAAVAMFGEFARTNAMLGLLP